MPITNLEKPKKAWEVFDPHVGHDYHSWADLRRNRRPSNRRQGTVILADPAGQSGVMRPHEFDNLSGRARTHWGWSGDVDGLPSFVEFMLNYSTLRQRYNGMGFITHLRRLPSNPDHLRNMVFFMCGDNESDISGQTGMEPNNAALEALPIIPPAEQTVCILPDLDQAYASVIDPLRRWNTHSTQYPYNRCHVLFKMDISSILSAEYNLENASAVMGGYIPSLNMFYGHDIPHYPRDTPTSGTSGNRQPWLTFLWEEFLHGLAAHTVRHNPWVGTEQTFRTPSPPDSTCSGLRPKRTTTDRPKVRLTIGADPEFELKQDRCVIAATRSDYHQTSLCGIDGAGSPVEYRPTAGRDGRSIVQNIDAAHADFVAHNPQYNLSVRGDNYAIGCHVHISMPKRGTNNEEHFCNPQGIPVLYDRYLTAPAWAQNGRARGGYKTISYANTGAMEGPKFHGGWEYRCLPASVLATPELAQVTFKAIEKLATKYLAGYPIYVPETTLGTVPAWRYYKEHCRFTKDEYELWAAYCNGELRDKYDYIIEAWGYPTPTTTTPTVASNERDTVPANLTWVPPAATPPDSMVAWLRQTIVFTDDWTSNIPEQVLDTIRNRLANQGINWDTLLERDGSVRNNPANHIQINLFGLSVNRGQFSTCNLLSPEQAQLPTTTTDLTTVAVGMVDPIMRHANQTSNIPHAYVAGLPYSYRYTERTHTTANSSNHPLDVVHRRLISFISNALISFFETL